MARERVLYVLVSTSVSANGSVDTIVHGVNSNYELLSDMAYDISESLMEHGYTFIDEIFSGGQTNRYYIDEMGNEYNLQITKCWIR